MTTAPVSRSSKFASRPSIYASRLFHRHQLDMRARIVAPRSNGEHEIIHGRTADLSAGGIGMMLTRELTPGLRVVLCLQLPESGTPLCVQAVVARCQGLRVGLKFLCTTPLQRLQLSKLCHA